jgi:hypothetical protein
MTLETDSIITYARTCAAASGVVVIVSDLNTPGAHVTASDHYKGRDALELRRPARLRRRQGRLGCRLRVPAQRQARHRSAGRHFRSLQPVEHHLDELFHSGPRVDHFLKYGLKCRFPGHRSCDDDGRSEGVRMPAARSPEFRRRAVELARLRAPEKGRCRYVPRGTREGSVPLCAPRHPKGSVPIAVHKRP